MEAGNRCFDQRVPEETNRKIVDHVSDINMPYSTIAREYLLAEGFPAEQVIKTGSPMFEVLEYYNDKIARSDVLKRLKLNVDKYFVVSSHREENVDDESRLKKIASILNSLCEKYDYPIIFSTHPRTRKRIDSFSIKLHKNIQTLKPLGFSDYVNLQMNAFCVISDSGTITEESSILNFPALNLRESHERPEGMEEGTVIMTGINLDCVMESLPIAVAQKRGNDRSLKIVSDYNVPDVSEKVLRIIMSYTEYIRRRVWYIND
jgi:UDP-N-acetylglucosamine 2-epimerase (non-hydrolysing)